MKKLRYVLCPALMLFAAAAGWCTAQHRSGQTIALSDTPANNLLTAPLEFRLSYLDADQDGRLDPDLLASTSPKRADLEKLTSSRGAELDKLLARLIPVAGHGGVMLTYWDGNLSSLSPLEDQTPRVYTRDRHGHFKRVDRLVEPVVLK